MQDPYTADIGDYVKLSILRALLRTSSRLRLGVIWYFLRDEEKRGDGRHREYLQNPETWRAFDPDLFDVLAKIEREQNRTVAALENCRLLTGATFVRDEVPCAQIMPGERLTERCKWFIKAQEKLAGSNLIFLDPDNGIGSKTLRLTQKRARKNVTIDEIAQLAPSGCKIVVYHHQTRHKGGHYAEICELAARLKTRGLQVSGVLRAKPWSPRAFFLVNGDQALVDAAKRIENVWKGLIRWHPIQEVCPPS